ncbi:Protein FAM8A1 [Orchesella cincta]|uniref:Protein FAM8A1 n=1 Tax=Orchesella cincta TaxID=48709 RepID=A0A1D2MIB3_ORCCI|nr:Protein FAM8A1 [Orchesella cincta]
MDEIREEPHEGDARQRQTSSKSNDDPPSSSTVNEEQLSANAEYCKQLENWLWKSYWQSTIAASAYFTALNQQYGNGSPAGSVPQQPQQQQRQPGGFRINFSVFANQLNNQQQRLGEPLSLVKIAPIWKRLLAEVIDFLILIVVKLLVTFTIVDNFDVIDFDSIDLSSFQQQDNDIRISSLYELAFTLSSELIILEIIHRLIACVFEGYCLSKSGCTPGKSLLNIRVIHAESIVPHPGNQADAQYALVAPASYLSFPRAFFRSAVKNFSLAFFFPLCFTLFHFDYSRTLYDMVGKSLVVENN